MNNAACIDEYKPKSYITNLNEVCSFKAKRNKTNVTQLKLDHTLLVNNADISNGFNSYFTNVSENIVNKLQSKYGVLDENEFKKYIGNPVVNSMYCDLVDKYELIDLIYKLNPSKCPGADNLGPKLIQDISSSIIDPFLHIYNLSLSTGVVPNKLKIAKVIPIFKRGDSHLPNNYRPISLLSVFSKLLEKVMYNRLYSFLQTNNILYQYQFGFRENHSTTLSIT